MSTVLYMVIEVIVALLLVGSGVLVLAAGLGLLRMRDIFMRMHVSALVPSLAAVLVTVASVIYLTALTGSLDLRALLVPAFLAVTTPVTTIFLARAALFRLRVAGSRSIPPTLTKTSAPRKPKNLDPAEE